MLIFLYNAFKVDIFCFHIIISTLRFCNLVVKLFNFLFSISATGHGERLWLAFVRSPWLLSILSVQSTYYLQEFNESYFFEYFYVFLDDKYVLLIFFIDLKPYTEMDSLLKI